MAQQTKVGQGLRTVEASGSHSVGLLWTNDRPDAETSLPDNTQHAQEKEIHAPGGIRTRNIGRRAAAYPSLRRRGHWDRLTDTDRSITAFMHFSNHIIETESLKRLGPLSSAFQMVARSNSLIQYCEVCVTEKAFLVLTFTCFGKQFMK